MLGGSGDDGRAPYQVAISRCEDCGRAWEHARGEAVELTPEEIERAGCDAQDIGAVGASHVGRSGKRATQTIPPAVRRQVVRRDGGRCRVPGCRNATFVALHHLRLRSEGGDHDPSRLLSLCEAHHGRVHAGLLLIEGDSVADVRFLHADGTEYGGRADAGAVEGLGMAYGALRSMGFREGETKRALAAVRSHAGHGTAEEIVRAALPVLTEGLSGAARPSAGPLAAESGGRQVSPGAATPRCAKRWAFQGGMPVADSGRCGLDRGEACDGVRRAIRMV